MHGSLDDDQKSAIGRIQRSARRLSSLIEDLLTFARIEAGRLELSLETVVVRDIVAGVETMTAPQVRAKGLTLSFENCDASLLAYADAEKVEQILINLVSNAIKFTPSGGAITITGDATPSTIEVRVSDSGIGIPPDKLEAVFEPFVQAGRSLASTREGTGLGLAISRDLARAMAGDLTVTSELNAGSTFTLTIPRPAQSHGG